MSDPRDPTRATYERVRAQFAATADAYVESRGHAEGAELARMVALAGDVGGARVLDVATGGGHTALAFARAGADVVATDLTPAMLAAARRFVDGEVGEGRVAFLEARAEALPFDDDAFAVVTCRIALHHFADPRAFVREAARVLAPGGRLLLVDNVAPAEPRLGDVMNRLERERDPSHVEAYPLHRLVGWLAEVGLETFAVSRWEVVKPFGEWLARARTPEGVARDLERFVLALPPRERRYLRVVEAEGRLVSLAHEAALIASRTLPA